MATTTTQPIMVTCLCGQQFEVKLGAPVSCSCGEVWVEVDGHPHRISCLCPGCTPTWDITERGSD